METVQQHEWKQSEMYSWLSICKHCGIDKVLDLNLPNRVFYNLRSPLLETTIDEPPCIARTKQPEDEKAPD